MQLAFYFALALAPTLILGFLLWKSQKQTLSMTNRLVAMNQTLTNLILSKDPMTFQQLQVMTSNQSQSNQFEEPVNPLDDASQAHALAESYKRHGLNPNAAYAQEDEPINFAEEFGL